MYFSIMAKLKRDPETNPINQKIVLFLFGIGPIIIMIGFLISQGFFS